MKKLLITLFTIFAMTSANADMVFEPYWVDPAATANAPWKVGEVVHSDRIGQNVFLGVNGQGAYIVQRFYPDGITKKTDPFLVLGVAEVSRGSLKSADGKIVSYYKNGQKNFESFFVNGRLEGLMTTWHENGQKDIESNYLGDKLEGTSTRWYENGQKRLEVNYVNGVYEGVSTAWYDNGQKKFEGTYFNGKHDGLWVGWSKSGQKIGEGNFIVGEKMGIWCEWDEEGNLIREHDYGTPSK